MAAPARAGSVALAGSSNFAGNVLGPTPNRPCCGNCPDVVVWQPSALPAIGETRVLRRFSRCCHARRSFYGATVGLLLLWSAHGGAAAADTPNADVVQVTVAMGFLSEWKFDVMVSKPDANDGFARRVTWKHVGLCSVNGPVEKPGELSVHISRLGPWSRIQANVSFEDMRCTYSGPYSTSMQGFADCPAGQRLPFAISFH